MRVRWGTAGNGRSWLLLVTLWLGLMAAPGAHAADPWMPFLSPWFERVGTTDGLPHSVTTALAQDTRGLVWIGTMGGLVRYDGFRMQTFDAADDASGLPDAYVRSLLALPDGGVLVGTNAGGLTRFDPRLNRFHQYPIGPGGTADRKIYDLAPDGHDGAWIATDRGLNHLDLASDKLTTVATGAGTAPRNFSVLQDRAGNLWLGNDRGLFVRRAGESAFRRPTATDATVSTVLHNQIWALHEDSHGRLWVGSGQTGAVYRDGDGSWHAVPGFSPTAQQHDFPTVRAFAENPMGSEWIATDGEGVLAYRPGAEAVRHFAHDAALASSLPGDTVRSLLYDASGNMWAATDLGAAHTNTHARMVCSLLPSPLDPFGLADSNVRTIMVDSRQRIWLGLGAGHIDLIDLAHGRLLHLQLQGSQSHRDVQAFAETPDGTIWAGTLGLARIDPDTLKITSDVEPRLASKPVLSLQQVDGSLLAGTYEGVFRFDPATRTLDHFRHDASDPTSLASDTVRDIAQIDGKIWYATTAGISVADHPGDDRGFHNITERAGQPDGLPQDYIGSIAKDAAGRIWIATFGGVAMLEHDTPDAHPTFHVFDGAAGLASTKINAVLPGDDGRIWAIMSNGIAVIDGASGKARNLGGRDGLHIPSYIYIATARAPDGSLLFGGLGGLTIVRPHDRWEVPEPVPPPSVTSARVGGKERPPGALPRSGDTLTIDNGHRGLQIGFAVLDYRAPLETRYSYRMEGFDEGWTDLPVGSPPSAVYTNLPHGQYTLRLRASTRGMYPTTVESDIKVNVLPRWYETVWVRTLAVLAGIALIVGLVHLRTLYLRRQAKRLQQQIDERTRDLQQANARLDRLAGTDELTGLYNRRRFLAMAEGVRALSDPGQACLAVLDLDRFKLINDNHGHLAGDAVIRAVTDIIVGRCRPDDLLGRYGGEELVICLPDCDAMQAMKAAERIREALEQADIRFEERAIRITTSIGVAALHRGETMEQWLSRADAALYEAKRRGRNRVVLADDD